MKIGDLVCERYVLSTDKERQVGIIIEFQDDIFVPPVARIMWCGVGEITKEYIDELETLSKTLTDDQLEDVRGGMSQQKFSEWRAEKLNESR